MKKFFTVALLMVITSCFGFVNAYANESASEEKLIITDTNIPFETSGDLDVFGSVSYHDALIVDGKPYCLYPIFDNQEYALKKVGSKCSNILEQLKTRYELSSFGKESVNDYNNRMFDFIEIMDKLKSCGELSSKDYGILEDEINSFEVFMDIYENEDSNNKIIDAVKKIDFPEVVRRNSRKADVYANLQRNVIDVKELEFLLPDNTGAIGALEDYTSNQVDRISVNTDCNITSDALLSEYTTSGANQYAKNSKFNVEKGIKYAKKWGKADTYNKTKYGRCSGGDCTNFTSQIKHEGGVPLYNGNTRPVRSPWKYYKYGNGKINWSARWNNADKFAKFFGEKSMYRGDSYSEKNRYQAFVNFSKAVKKGSFIGFCYTSDGDWDHMGFVTEITNNYKTYKNGYKYKDFRVAQHSKGYNALVSSSTNGWENIIEKNRSAIYGIIY